jgi:phosphopantothenate--cysteine ligase
MNILITAGGTSEQIDPVRAISNTATGRLGSIIADTFAEKEYCQSIYYVCGKTSVLPKTNKAKIYPISGTSELESTIRRLLAENRTDVIIHSMAVSDYSVGKVSTASFIAKSISDKLGNSSINADTIKQWVFEAKPLDNTGKISSSIDDMVIFMKRTPKIISLFRALSPDSVIVGFKLLNGVEKDILIDTAFSLLAENQCDYVLANDLAAISENAHPGYLIDSTKNYECFKTKQEIAHGIVRAVERQIR